jgi:imidazolonepropionase
MYRQNDGRRQGQKREAKLGLCDRIWRNARLFLSSVGADQANIIDDGLIACKDGRIVYAGPNAEAARLLDGVEVIDCGGRWITPGLIDCHTHLVYGGNRSHEFEQRLAGARYEDIARAGGGILFTMKATRDASDIELTRQSLARLDAMLASGLTTIEIKSGYGLSLEAEIKQLRVARGLAKERAITVCTSLLAAHTVPPEFRHDPDAYVTMICEEIIPAVARLGLADAVDGFCENIGFMPAQITRVFTAARKEGLPVKLHAEQLSNLHGAVLAAANHALSADHLEYLDEDGINAMSAAGTVAVLLPGAFYFTREVKLPPIEGLRQKKVPIAVATDCNPGTSPLTSPLLAMNMAATCFRLTVEECLIGMTRNAAKALGLENSTGSLEPGKFCDLAIWDIERPADLVYRMGWNPLHARIWRGI